MHQHRLDERPVIELERPLDGPALVGRLLGHHPRSGGQLLGEAGAQGDGQVGHLLDPLEAAVEAVEDLPRPEGRLVGQYLGEVLELVKLGALDPPEPTAYPLDHASEALDDLLNRRVTGKAALVMGR